MYELSQLNFASREIAQANGIQSGHQRARRNLMWRCGSYKSGDRFLASPIRS